MSELVERGLPHGQQGDFELAGLRCGGAFRPGHLAHVYPHVDGCHLSRREGGGTLFRLGHRCDAAADRQISARDRAKKLLPRPRLFDKLVNMEWPASGLLMRGSATIGSRSHMQKGSRPCPVCRSEV
jgi:hypothetical protein